MGTGDCFALKFFKDDQTTFKILIDSGSISGGKEHFTPFVENLKDYLDNQVDVLVITHEHNDHVLAFQRCKDLFTENFQVDEIWMGWPEKDGDPTVEAWKTDYGQKKLALKLASDRLEKMINSNSLKKEFDGHEGSAQLMGARKHFVRNLNEISNLHVAPNFSANDGEYKGLLGGMKVVKEDIADNNISYYRPGDILRNILGLEGVKIYILGPPELYRSIEVEDGGEGESYSRNLNLSDQDTFGLAVLSANGYLTAKDLPFDKDYLVADDAALRTAYDKESWRSIDYDWLYASGSLALRLEHFTNNLSLVMAIEFEESGKIMLFPGDAEYGSWASWHNIHWNDTSDCSDALTTEQLLNRTVFYKVAHHLSHNGTAKRLGLNMMTHPELTAMATLDYGRIGSSWTNTMPNNNIIEELLTKTKGRLIIMNEDQLEHRGKTMTEAILEAKNNMTSGERQHFDNAFVKNDLFFQFTVFA